MFSLQSVISLLRLTSGSFWLCKIFNLSLSFPSSKTIENEKYFSRIEALSLRSIWRHSLWIIWFSLSCLHQAKPQDTLDLCQFLNNDLAATVARYPRRFVGLGTLPMQAPELAVQEMERCVKELGFPGIQIGSHINEWDLNERELFPIYTVSRTCSAQAQLQNAWVRGPWETGGWQGRGRCPPSGRNIENQGHQIC